MIKINLALRKQATALDVQRGGARQIRVDADALKSVLGDAQLRKLVLAAAVAVLGTYLLNGYQSDQLAKADQLVQQANMEQAKVRASLAKASGYDGLKKQFDADEELIKTKLSTIQKLSSDRQAPPRILASLSGSIPKDVWITEMSITTNALSIKGSSLGFDQITDFMKVLGDNEFFADLKLKDSQKQKTQAGLDVATFDIEARRK